MLQKFYANQAEYSFAFQMMAYISRLTIIRENVREIMEAVKKAKEESKIPRKYILITERSLYTDKYVFAKMLYDQGKIEDVKYQIYLNWFDTFSNEFPVHKVVYVKTAPEICHARIAKRAREGEDCIPLEYLQSCHKYHEDMLQTNNITQDKLVLDGNVDIYENANQIGDWLYQIYHFTR
jgi:deoxyadenosine/deoxycytidine kinase